MTEKSGFWNTEGVSPVGDQLDGYNEIVWSDAASILASCSGFEGVGASLLNALEVTVTDLNEVTVDTGGAVVDGKWYKNDAGKAVVIPSAVGSGNTRIDRIVLRCSWADFTVRVHRIAGTDAGSPTAPAITQISGTTYDIKLCQVLVTTSGVVTVTDERVWARVPVDDTTISVYEGKLRVKDVGITAPKIATNAVETVKIKDLNVTAAKLASNAVETAKIKDANVTAAKIADGTITEAKLNTTAKIFDPPAAGLNTTSSLSIPNNSWTLVSMGQNSFELGDIGANYATNRITINVTGTYLVTAILSFAGSSTGIRGIAIYQNGASKFVVSNNGSSDGSNLNISHVMKLTATQYIQLYAYQNSGVALATVQGYEGAQLTATYLRS